MVSRVATVVTGALAMLWSTAYGGTVWVPGMSGSIEVSVTSYQAQRFSTIMRQQYDFSCGSAAVASLLTYHYQDPVSEQDVFNGMLELADVDKVRREGFSMLDMKRFLEHRGYVADGFRMPLKGLREQIRLPAIALVTLEGYRHFVVIKGISDDSVLVGDPARGIKEYARVTFERQWDGAAFVIRSHLAQGRSSFYQAGDWPPLAKAPFSAAEEGPGIGHSMPYWPSSREW
ncbi:MAG: C39 family peptidase [Marinobacter sp.]|nr:C39 family peptidase [Marinobacter sp.]